MVGILMKYGGPLFLYIISIHILTNKSAALSSDGEALLSFRNSIISSDGVLRQWRPEDPDPCGWKGVKCDSKTKRVIYLSLSHRKLSGSISTDIGKLEHLKLLTLNNNNLYGTIPTEIGNCTELQSLYLQGNFLGGSIPSALGNLSELQNLDISSNTLSGHIPPSLGMLNNLSIFNMSSNFLTGPIPSDGVLNSFPRNSIKCFLQTYSQGDIESKTYIFKKIPDLASCGRSFFSTLNQFVNGSIIFSFVGNLGLCGKQIDVACKDDGSKKIPGSDQYQKKNNSGRLFISASATVGALLLVALMCFWGCFLYKKLGKNDGRCLAMDVSGGASIVMFHGDLPYSSKDIIKKLETLTGDHIIGSGGFATVYKLAMDDGNIFAVKKIMKLNEGFDHLFKRELEILGSIKHRYLVNLRGYCNSPTSKLLIYDYLPGGTLDEALHERPEQLDWDARLNIIVGAAKGLAYLHHDCSPRVIHRDIKSSNILLDGNLEARVSDFGLAKLLKDEESHITTIVAGTFGYLAPEYMQSGRATEKTDVYSFGVLVLEVLSGKRPTDASFIEKGINIVGWLNFLVTENRQWEILDPFCEGVPVERLDALLSVAILCVSPNAEERPTMHRLLQVLESEVMTPCPSEFYDSNSEEDQNPAQA